jgi:FkbM family methyltransferase
LNAKLFFFAKKKRANSKLSMFRLLLNCLKYFGLGGILVYTRIKLKLTSSLPLPGYKHPILLRNSQSDLISFREIFFKKEYAIQLPANFKPTVIIDAGGNIGLTSVYFATQYPEAKIICIEPDENNYLCMIKNVGAYSNITPIHGALWHALEKLTLSNKGYGNRGFMLEQGTDNLIPTVTINHLLNQFNLSHIDILKIDIEGSEKEVFSGEIESWLPKTKCLVIELHDRMKPGCSKAVFQAINQFDFSLSIKGENLIFINSNFKS